MKEKLLSVDLSSSFLFSLSFTYYSETVVSSYLELDSSIEGLFYSSMDFSDLLFVDSALESVFKSSFSSSLSEFSLF